MSRRSERYRDYRFDLGFVGWTRAPQGMTDCLPGCAVMTLPAVHKERQGGLLHVSWWSAVRVPAFVWNPKWGSHHLECRYFGAKPFSPRGDLTESFSSLSISDFRPYTESCSARVVRPRFHALDPVLGHLISGHPSSDYSIM